MYTAIRWDLKGFSYLRFIFNSDAIRDGIFPLWNPYPFGGCPWISNFQACLFHPINLLIILILGYSAAILQFQQVLTFFLGGLAMYYCVRQFHVSRPAAILSSISFIGCGFFVATGSHFQLTNTFAIFPLCFALTHRLAQKPNLINLTLGALCFAIMIFTGYPTMAFFLMANCFVYGLLAIGFIDRNIRTYPLYCGILLLIGMFVVATLLSSILLIPAFESFPFLTRAEGMDTPPEIVIKRSLSPYNLINVVFPYLGTKNLALYRLNRTFRNCSIGLIGLWFSCYYLLFKGGRIKIILGCLLIVNIVLSFGFNTPIYNWVYRYFFPFKIASQPAADFRGAFIFFLCLIAGLGADRFFKNVVSEKLKLGISCMVLLSICFPLLFYIGTIFKLAIIQLIIANYFWFISFVLFIVLVNIKIPAKYLYGLLLILCIIDVSHWVKTNFRTIGRLSRPGEWVNLKNAEREREKSVIHYKGFGRRQEFPAFEGAWSMFWKYFSDSGYDSTKLMNFFTIMHSPAKGVLNEAAKINPVYEVKLLDNEKEVLGEIYDGADLHNVTLIDRQDIGDDRLLKKLKGISQSESGEASFQGEVLYYSPNKIEYEVILERPAIIFFNEIYYPGWLLKEGNKEIPLFRINGAFRGAYLEMGQHNLVMTFSPMSFKLGLILSFITVLFCIGAISVACIRKS